MIRSTNEIRDPIESDRVNILFYCKSHPMAISALCANKEQERQQQQQQSKMLRYWHLTLLSIAVAIQAQRLPVELCDSLPCANGGKCYQVLNPVEGVLMDPQCLCASNFTGTLCETPAACTRTCQNGGTCSFGEGDNWWLEDEEFLQEIFQMCAFEPGGLNLTACGEFERSDQYCQCPPNVYGSDCEILCNLECENNGICEPWRDKATCRCDYPFYGDLCQESCSKDCQNGGRCVAYDFDNDNVLEQTCLCPANFTGDLCETPKPCSKACVNGGVCQQESNWWFEEAEYFDELFEEIFYDCQLQSGLSDISACFDLHSREYCQCPAGYFGEFCQVTCEFGCLNEGVCEVRGNEARCRCQPGYFGEMCEEVCDLQCENGGICVAYDTNNDAIKEKHCLCPSNSTGDLCTEPRTCQNECLNGGECVIEREDWFFYEPEFIDSIFEEEILMECSYLNEQENIFEDPALDLDRCIMDIIGIEYCQCPPNTWGSQCENTCDLDCGVNGNCTFSRFTEKRCTCRPGYSGDSCQYECTLNCENNGRCVADGVSEYCQCSSFFEGPLCQTQKACTKTCANGGSCVFTEGFGYNEPDFWGCINENNGDCPDIDYFERCDCPQGWVGADCSIPCPCQNGGTCSTFYRRLDEDYNDYWPDRPPYYNDDDEEAEEEDSGYYCNCPFGFYGINCQFEFGNSGCTIQCNNGGYCEKDFIWDHVADGSDGSNHNHDDDYDYEYDYEYDYDDQLQNNAGGDHSENDNSNGSNYNGPNQNQHGHSDHDHTDVPPVEGPPPTSPGGQERCVCPGNFTGPTCDEFIDACYNLCQNGVCSTDASSTQRRFGGRSLESVWVPDPNNPYSDYGAPGHFGPFCQCDEGYSGEYCERKACGSGYCANGAVCIELPSGQTTSAGDDYVCDCSVASLGPGFDETTFIGRQCDGAVHHECFSDDKKNPNENWACANYGRCFYGSSGPECLCDLGWEGSRCEANSTDAKDIAWSQCTLPCNNGGTCLKGVAKPVARMFSRFLEATKKTKLFEYEPSPNYEYCYCPTGFFGVGCEKQYELCGNGEHICFHGSTCEQTGGEWKCDCTGTKSAGLYCMYEATDECGDSDDETFCTNGAACGADKQCSCLEGWEGDKCEVEIKAATIQGGDDKWSGGRFTSPFAAISLIIVPSIALVTM